MVDATGSFAPGRALAALGRAGRMFGDAAPAMVRIDDHAYLADVARPPLQRHDGDVAENCVAVDGERTRRARAHPRRAHLGIVDVLLEERAVAFRDPLQEARHRGLVGGLEAADLHQRSFGGSSSSLCSVIHFASAGWVYWSAVRPAAKVTWPPRKRSSSRRAGSPTSSSTGSDAATGTTLSFSATA